MAESPQVSFKKVLVINGPNLNLLGRRELEIYGEESLDDIREFISGKLGKDTPKWEWFQSNSEAKLIDRIHHAMDESWDGMVLNLGAFSHTSVALLDALKAYSGLKIEVHLSNTNTREEFRRTKITAQGVHAVIEGLKKDSYLYAIRAILNAYP